MMLPWRALRARGVLGMNRRNLRYVHQWGERHLYPRVDDKLLTKKICAEAGIPTPQLIGAAQSHSELRRFVQALGDHTDFVVKPARGAMGNGVMVIVGRDGERFRRSGGTLIDAASLRYHAASIISGLFALGGHRDVAFAEERLRLHPELIEIASEGVADLRIVVYRGVPVMAMTRLPTARSRGRANLHQGAVGAGVSLASGRITHAVLEGEAVTEHPDTGRKLVGRELPGFERAVEVAVAATDRVELTYVGADVVVDAQRGPLILELNARPGLAIQLANRRGLLPRLDASDAKLGRDAATQLPPLERIAFGRQMALGEPG